MIGSNDNPECASAPVRVLVVDDNLAEVELLRSAVAKFGFAELASIQDGRKALETTHHDLRQFDLILIDWRLPGLHGDAVAKAFLSRQDQEDAVPVVLFSSGLPPQIADELREAGAVVIDKPIDLDGYDGLAARLAALARRPITLGAAT